MLNRSQIYTSYMYSYPHKTAYRELEQCQFDQRLLAECGSLYFHIPFCETKCGYCNLFSIAGAESAYFERYLEAMRDQLEQYGLLNQEQIRWESLTVGGGTPLLLPVSLLEQLFELAVLAGAAGVYSCIETSPNQTSWEKVAVLKKHQVDRVSIGIQSFQEEELRFVSRRHSAGSALKALELLKTADFPCLNIDLIYGMANQTTDSIKDSLKQALKFEPDEIFIYPLYVRAGTRMGKAADMNHPDTYQFYLMIRDYLTESGYFQLSMRRFVKVPPPLSPGCGFEQMVSIGCGGRSYLSNLHFCTPYQIDRVSCKKQIDQYISQKDKKVISHGYRLNQEEQKRRFIIKNLLYYAGLDLVEYQRIFGTECSQEFPVFDQLISQNYCRQFDRRLILTPLGMSLSDYIGPMFISDEVKTKMEAFYAGGAHALL